MIKLVGSKQLGHEGRNRHLRDHRADINRGRGGGGRADIGGGQGGGRRPGGGSRGRRGGNPRPAVRRFGFELPDVGA